MSEKNLNFCCCFSELKIFSISLFFFYSFIVIISSMSSRLFSSYYWL